MGFATKADMSHVAVLINQRITAEVVPLTARMDAVDYALGRAQAVSDENTRELEKRIAALDDKFENAMRNISRLMADLDKRIETEEERAKSAETCAQLGAANFVKRLKAAGVEGF